MKHKQAFSLIELMVVISIIAVLAAMGVANFAAAIKKSRDSVRKSELAELTQAIMMFRADWGSYPNPGDTVPLTSSSHLTYLGPDGLKELVPDYIRSMPFDEVRKGMGDNVQYTYKCLQTVNTTVGATAYKRCVDFSVCAFLEAPEVSGANSTTREPTSGSSSTACSGAGCEWFCMYSP